MKLASIEKIVALRAHPNADRLNLATVLGWQMVTAKDNNFQVGDHVVFLVIDTVVPKTDWSHFLVDPKNPDKPIRLKTVKLRGEFSQGLILPISILPEDKRDLPEGTEVSEILGVTKYVKPVPAELAGIMKEPFPQQFCARTDEENGLSHSSILNEIVALGDNIIATQKMDGSSCTVIWKNGEGILHVCSRELSLIENDGNPFWKVAKRLNTKELETVSKPGEVVVIQGELMGPKCQGNQLELTDFKLFIFTMSVGGPKNFIKRSLIAALATAMGAETPKGVYRGPVLPMGELLALADSQVLPNGKPCEGIVVRPENPAANSTGRPLGFKIINRNYKDT